jgi:pimeloyl-ACP methyl ester carboxylesterase
MDSTKPTVVLVHGAWADNSGWDGSIRTLRGQGFRAVGAANPLRDLRSDAAYVAALLRSIEGPIVMVGHSYGGAVISNAATGNDQVTALVYINGWVPDEGESLIQLAELNEGSLIPDSLQPVPHKNADGSDVVDLYLDQEKFRAAFAGDVDPETAQVMAVTQRPFTETAFGAPSGPVAWRSMPSWYLLGTEDKAIPPATQRYMAERAKASIVDIPASHASMVSQPDAVTDLILTAVKATAGRQRAEATA